MLSDAQVERYSRQIILPEVGARGQETLLSAMLALVDTADRLSVLPLYLAAAGIGRLNIWKPGKTASNEWRCDIADLNPDCEIEVRTATPSLQSCETFVRDSDPAAVILIEDSVEIAAQLNVACVQARKPLVWGCVVGAAGYLTVFDPMNRSGCRACLRLSDLGEPTRQVGTPVLQPLTVATLASLLASEAIKLVLGNASALNRSLLRIDTDAATVTTLPFAADPNCAVCSARAHA